MSALDRSTVHHYAKLANLAFSPEQADVMAHELASILEYVNKISELDLSDTEPTFSTFGQGCHTREDRTEEGLGAEEALRNAPDKESQHFLVPKMIHTRELK
ncbi:MAG: Asp-tRNA(Asn)/Glu-tRNA(Gln) amidotransferase subunit GatC [Acidobacteria bacterium]|nr:Asp-tRNA(Asn)/Glu-tRNA(Gln) amidotransferase subunit GatC [Acidobacteriota bacterium]